MKSDQSLGNWKNKKMCKFFLKKALKQNSFFYSKHKNAPMRQELFFYAFRLLRTEKRFILLPEKQFWVKNFREKILIP